MLVVGVEGCFLGMHIAVVRADLLSLSKRIDHSLNMVS